MIIQVNGEPREVLTSSTLTDLVAHLKLAAERLAIELNHKVIRRPEWAQTVLSEGDRVEIVHFVGGGEGQVTGAGGRVTGFKFQVSSLKLQTTS